jgi:hypothetical protein
MSLDKADTIDLVSLTADGKTIVLHLVATRSWPSTGEGSLLLQAKLKNYVAFAADGQLIRQYPQAKDKNVRIEIRSDYPLGVKELELVAAARKHWCEPDGIALHVAAGTRNDAA